ncbi:hypothetical protein ATN84_05300 [Paramesorhizobium deserti]|uniref:Biotin carboxylase n=1 Tax=Paramesorhizobium deserti TaxID=1494590 RepID=A0A135I164_9HYPH|nr:DUF3182 family protein [Paramesorhizobium deserti]KXF79148.1 hypothetical protein ATN84_05300 [Paramesorhizobium deserti]
MKNVVLSHAGDQSPHKLATLVSLGRRIAEIKGCAFLEAASPAAFGMMADCYYVPLETIALEECIGREAVFGCHDLFGGIVPHAFMATKVITHPLAADATHAPESWRNEFCDRVQGIVLEGFSVFTAKDLIRAAEHLLSKGRVRIKSALADGGHGQTVIADKKTLHGFVDLLEPTKLTGGYVVEEDMEEVTTYSVGQVVIDDISISYFGTQRTTTDNRNRPAYGGTRFCAVRGNWSDLTDWLKDAAAKRIVRAGKLYDDLAQDVLQLVASRKNYDVLVGTDSRGKRKIGVLEQSWRLGGATSAELLALEALKETPSLAAVEASSYEVYGRTEPSTRADLICFAGEDPQEGPMTKYARLEARYHV